MVEESNGHYGWSDRLTNANDEENAQTRYGANAVNAIRRNAQMCLIVS